MKRNRRKPSARRSSRPSPRAGGREASGGGAEAAPGNGGERWFAELPGGLENVGVVELERLGARSVRVVSDGARFDAESASRFLNARTVSAIYRSLTFEVPRPKALLGDASFRRLSAAVQSVMRAGAAERRPLSFAGLRIAAAGADSPVMARLGAELAAAAGLTHDQEAGELLVRLRPEPLGSGWEALVRLTPRPLTARDWRLCNREGGLNAAIAAAMIELVGARAGDRFLNLMCGSGTLLVERALAVRWGRPDGSRPRDRTIGAERLVGVDEDPEALACAERNLTAAGVHERVELLRADATDLPFRANEFNVIMADAPWGDAVGAHAQNARLYPELLGSAARVAVRGARFALLTHEVKLTQGLLETNRQWRVVRELRVQHGGHTPLLALLERR